MKKIRKTYSGVVPNGKVLNSRNDSLQDTYSSDYLNRTIPDTKDLGKIIVDDIKCKNLLPNYMQSQTVNGVEITKHKDGSMTLNGTSTDNTTIITVVNISLNAGTYTHSISKNDIPKGLYMSLDNLSDFMIGTVIEGKKTFTLTEAKDYNKYYLYFDANTVFNNFKIYPMLEPGTVDTDFVEHKEFNSTNYVLYSNANGSNTDIILNDSPSNYKYLEIFYKTNDNVFSSIKLNVSQVSFFELMAGYMPATSSSDQTYYLKVVRCRISGNTISFSGFGELSFNATKGFTFSNSKNNMYITHIIGCK